MNDFEFPPKPRFYIVNLFDRPDAKFVTELGEDGMLHYIHPELREKWKNQGLLLHAEATPLEDFGLEVNIEDGVFYAHYKNEAKAKYPDGRPRFWQGDPNFFFRYPGPPGTPSKPMNVLDLIAKPSEINSSEYAAIYECLDDNDVFQNPEMAIAICEEFMDHAQSIITRIQAAMENTPPDALETTSFSRN